MAAPHSRKWESCQPRRNIAAAAPLKSSTPKEAPMTDQPIDPAATPADPDAPEIAADDAGASAAAERAQKHAANDDEGESA